MRSIITFLCLSGPRLASTASDGVYHHQPAAWAVHSLVQKDSPVVVGSQSTVLGAPISNPEPDEDVIGHTSPVAAGARTQEFQPPPVISRTEGRGPKASRAQSFQPPPGGLSDVLSHSSGFSVIASTSHLLPRDSWPTATPKIISDKSLLILESTEQMEGEAIGALEQRADELAAVSIEGREKGALTDEHNFDQDRLREAWELLSRLIDHHTAHLAGVDRLREQQHSASMTHRGCRSEESSICSAEASGEQLDEPPRQSCEERLVELAEQVEVKEEAVQAADHEVYGGECHNPGKDRESVNRRGAKMELYSEAMDQLDAANVAYSAALLACEHGGQPCEEEQRSLEVATCVYAREVEQLHAAHRSNFSMSRFAYEQMKGGIRIRESDRKFEHRSTEVGACMIHVFDAGGADDEVDACSEVAVDTTFLDVEYYEVPPIVTLPVIPHAHCSAEYVDQQYSGFEQCAAPAACLELDTTCRLQPTLECPEGYFASAGALPPDLECPNTAVPGQCVVSRMQAFFFCEVSAACCGVGETIDPSYVLEHGTAFRAMGCGEVDEQEMEWSTCVKMLSLYMHDTVVPVQG